MENTHLENELVTEAHDSVSSENKKIENNSRINQVKKYFMYVMVGGFVVSALISIFAVLLGEFNEAIARALSTTLTIVVHSLVAIAFMSIKHKKNTDEIVINTLFGVTVVSLLGSILGIWKVIEGQTVTDIYQACFYAVVAAVIIRAVLGNNRIDKITRILANSTVGVTIFTFVLLMPSVFTNYPNTLPEFYQRLLWATIILQVTLWVLVSIFNRLYLNQHPELIVKKVGKSETPTVVKVILFIICLPIIFFVLGLFIRLLFVPFGY